MMNPTLQASETLMLGVFESVQHAANVVDRLLDAGLDPAGLGVLMSDRTAERHFGPPNPRNELGAAGTYSGNVNRLAVCLTPMAALGTAGSGLVATGQLSSALVSAGLGSGAGLVAALRGLGADRGAADIAAQRIKNGAVLLCAPVDDSASGGRWARLVEHEGEPALRLHVDDPRPNVAVVAPPQAPAGDQQARYEPAIESPEAARGSRTGASRLGS